MGKRDAEFDIVAPAPPVIAEGSSGWDEYVVRRTFPDGRIVDSVPMQRASAAMAVQLWPFTVPVGVPVAVTVRHRRVEVVATSWADVDRDALVEPVDARTAEDLPAARTDADPTRDVSDAAARARAERDRVSDDEVHAHTLGMPCPVGGCRWPADEQFAVPEVHWWVALDRHGDEVSGWEPYEHGAEWTVGEESPALHSLGFAAVRGGPVLVTTPVGRAVRKGDVISIAGPASGGQVPLRIESP